MPVILEDRCRYIMSVPEPELKTKRHTAFAVRAQRLCNDQPEEFRWADSLNAAFLLTLVRSALLGRLPAHCCINTIIIMNKRHILPADQGLELMFWRAAVTGRHCIKRSKRY